MENRNANPTSQDDGLDESLLEAQKQVELTGNMLPILKEELKLFVQSRRLTEGKDELQVEFEPEQCYELRPEEIERNRRRKEQNKQAAKRHRQKGKDTREQLKKEIQKLESSNTSLRNEISTLRKEKGHLNELLDEHMNKCHNVQLY